MAKIHLHVVCKTGTRIKHSRIEKKLYSNDGMDTLPLTEFTLRKQQYALEE